MDDRAETIPSGFIGVMASMELFLGNEKTANTQVV